jgi:hypothetical protein
LRYAQPYWQRPVTGNRRCLFNIEETKAQHQKLNTKSSTKAEIVGIDDVLPQALWTKYFMEVQGYGVSTILNQDN